MESQAIAQKLKPTMLEEEIGGWPEIDLTAWQKLAKAGRACPPTKVED